MEVGNSMHRLQTANVVVTAENFNPSILGEAWLVKHGIITEDLLADERVFTPPFVRMPTPEFTIVAVPDRIQFMVANPTAEAQDLIESKVGSIVNLLPHTPYRAVGLNFHWEAITMTLDNYAKGLRQMFVKQDSSVYRYFAEVDARFGGYFSKDVLGFRLRLTIEPIAGERDGTPFAGLRYHFNFNKDLKSDTAIKQIHDSLRRWSEVMNLSKDMFESTSGWLNDA